MGDEHQRVMGFWRTWGLTIGMMVGSGVFMLPTVLAPFGKYGLYAWLVTGGGTIAMALSLAYMARRVTQSGGPYAYTRAGFGNFAGFLMAWGYWVSVWVSVAAVTVAFVGYLGEFAPVLKESPNLALGAGLLLIWSLVALNYRSVEGSSSVQLVTSLAKFLPLLFLALFGLINTESVNFASMAKPEDGLNALSSASALAMWAFIGFEVATIPAGEVKDSARTIPRALMAAVVGAALLYFGVTAAAFGLLPSETLIQSTAPLADAASALVGPGAAFLVVVVALIATGSGVNANMFTVGQLPMAVAIDGLFPARFATLTRHGTPGFGFILGGTLASIALALNFAGGLIAAFEFLILLATITAIVPVAFSCAATGFFSLKYKAESLAVRARDIAVALIGFSYALWLVAGSGRDTVFWTFLLLLASLPIYVVIKAKNEAD